MVCELVSKFVGQKNGLWCHQDWLDFLSSVRTHGYNELHDTEVGQILEEEKARFITRPES